MVKVQKVYKVKSKKRKVLSENDNGKQVFIQYAKWMMSI